MSATNQKPISLLLLFVIALAAPLSGLRVDPREYKGGRSRDGEDRTVRNHSILASLMGELRTSASDMMFLKTERYLHSGVAYLNCSHIQSVGEMRDVIGEDSSAGLPTDQHHQDHDENDSLHDAEYANRHEHEDLETVIPAAESDFRGVIGWLHREVKPWRDPSEGHTHTDGSELLPWFRVMTVTDPHYVMGYAVGGWWISQYDENNSLAYLSEGIQNNPESFQIRLTRGLLQLRMLRREHGKNQVLQDGVFDDIRTAVRIGVAQRPASYNEASESTVDWSSSEESDLWMACQTLVLMEEQYGSIAESKRLAQLYVRIFPDNKILQKRSILVGKETLPK